MAKRKLTAEDLRVYARAQEERDRIKSREKQAEQDRTIKALASELDKAEERARLALELKAHRKPIKIEASKSTGKSEGIAIALASDWHVGQTIIAAKVNYLNEFNPDVARQRAARFFRHTLKLVDLQRRDMPVDSLILWLGGDFLSGWIHAELQQTNAMTPLEEALFAQDLISGGLRYLLDHGHFKRIIIPCSIGNHGRTTHYNQHANANETNTEWLLYRSLANQFSDEKTIQFEISAAYYCYLEVFGRVLRFSHGHNVRYQGGVGGVSIPLNKAVARANQQRRADMDSIGHFHQRIPYAEATRWQINGSLVGFDPFALAIGASPEPPVQNFALLDSRRGVTIQAPIILAEDV